MCLKRHGDKRRQMEVGGGGETNGFQVRFLKADV